MKALLYTKPYCFEYSDFPDPEMGDDEVLISVKALNPIEDLIEGFTLH